MTSIRTNIQGWNAVDSKPGLIFKFSSEELTPATTISISEALPPATTSRSTSSSLSPKEEEMKRQIPFTYTSASSERRAIRNRERDPSWVPRPANAFIIFRSEYSREHAQSHKTDGTPPPPEKTLSKRAAEAWSKLTEDEKAPYKVRADEERIEHAKRFPDYRYRPRRRNSGANRSSAAPSRREQVESFMRRAAASHNHGTDSESDYSAECSSPATSITGSSSPEPPDIAISSSVDSRDPRSQSFPRGNMSLRTRSGLPFFNGSTPSLTSSGDVSVPLFSLSCSHLLDLLSF